MTVTSIFGIQNGFNTTELVESLIALQQKPLELKVAEREFQVEKLDLLQDLRNRVSSFKSLTRTLGEFDVSETIDATFTGTGGTPGQVNVTPTGNPVLGTYNVNVTQLAQGMIRQSVAFRTYTSPNDLVIDFTGNGETLESNFDLDVNGVITTFTTADFIPGNDYSLQDVADIINASAADVTATVVVDGGGDFEINLADNQTGATSSVSGYMQITGGANDLPFNDPTGIIQNGLDSAFTVNGNPFSDATNTNTTAIPGLTLQLVTVGTGDIVVTQDTSSLKKQIEDFVDAYNDLQQFFRDQAFFDTVTLESGPLFGHYSVRNLQDTLSRTVTDVVNTNSGTLTALAQIGITTQDDGDLFINESKLDSALGTDAQGVIELFGKNGVATDSDITFNGFTDATTIGTFELQVDGSSNLQIRQVGEPSFTTMVNVVGNVYTGAVGTTAEGLTIEINPAILVPGPTSQGTLTIDSGAADQLTRELTFLADVTQNGPLLGDINTVSGTIEDLNETILKLDDRLQLFEEQIRQEFINLEIILGQLDAQRRAFQSSINSLAGLFTSNNR